MNIQADSIDVESRGRITAATQFSLGEGANINLDVSNDITLKDSGLISAQSIATSQGKIQPARGIKIAKSSKIILTAYRTSDAGERLPEIKRNCDRI